MEEPESAVIRLSMITIILLFFLLDRLIINSPGLPLNNEWRWTATYKSRLIEEGNIAALFKISPTRYQVMDGSQLPSELVKLKSLSTDITPGEYEPLSFLILADKDLKGIKLKWTDFNSNTSNLSFSIIDPYIVKTWYQAGITNKDLKNKILVGELLLKDDNLIKVDLNNKTNYLLGEVKGKKDYYNISGKSTVFPAGMIIKDAAELQPFNIGKDRYRQIWLIVHVPENTRSGIYESIFTITDNDGSVVGKFPLKINVLPFKLSPSSLTYSLYYHGILRHSKVREFDVIDKTESQLIHELKDMKEHGVLYPSNYQKADLLDKNLIIRNRIGLPKDRLYSTMLEWFKGPPKSQDELLALSTKVVSFQRILNKNGYKELYVYGIDEASGKQLEEQRAAWEAARKAGARIFVACYKDAFNISGDILDVAVMYGPLLPSQAKLYHSMGNKIFSYANPQVGQENPEIYRRNYGYALWKAGYDGAMDYAYQKNYNNIWNDFDHYKYREETFTYPTSNGIISTVQWEGFREAVDDIRYLSTLLDVIDWSKRNGKNTNEAQNFIRSIDPNNDPDRIRAEIIKHIIKLQN